MYSILITFIFALFKLGISYAIVNFVQNSLLIKQYTATGIHENIIYIISLTMMIVVYFGISKIFSWLFGNAAEKRSLRLLENYIQNITQPSTQEWKKEKQYIQIIEKIRRQENIENLLGILGICIAICLDIYIFPGITCTFIVLATGIMIGKIHFPSRLYSSTIREKTKNFLEKFLETYKGLLNKSMFSKEEKQIINSGSFQEFLHKYIFLQKYKRLEDVEENSLGQGIFGFITSFMICLIIFLLIILAGGSTVIAVITFMLMLIILYVRNTYFAMQKIGLKESDMYKKFFPNGTETMQNISEEELIEKERKKEKSKNNYTIDS